MRYTVSMEFSKKYISVIIVLLIFIVFCVWEFVFNSHAKHIVSKVISPIELILDNDRNIKFEELETFYPDYTESNKNLARKLDMNEDEAFIFGNLGKYWAKNLVENRKVTISDNNLKYYKFGYKKRLINSPFVFINSKPANKQAFNRQLSSIRKGKFVILDLDTDTSYPV